MFVGRLSESLTDYGKVREVQFDSADGEVAVRCFRIEAASPDAAASRIAPGSSALRVWENAEFAGTQK